MSSKDKQFIIDLRRNIFLVAKPYVACQARQVDIKDLFVQKKSALVLLPFLILGNCRNKAKNQIIVSWFIKSDGESVTDTRDPKVISLTMDGDDHMLIPKSNLTLQQYLNQTVQPNIFMRLKTVDRVDFVFDQCIN